MTKKTPNSNRSSTMIDRNGFRLNVGIIITNNKGQLFWGKRVKASGWQFPQGGVQPYETLEETMYRELKEEVGLNPDDIKLIAITKRWLYYKLPEHMVHHNKTNTTCIGQKQKWFLLRLNESEENIDLAAGIKPEFSDWRWIEYWLPLKQVVYFKHEVYKKVLTEFEYKVESLRQNSPK